MFGRNRNDVHDEHTVARRDVMAARGGVSPGAVLTGTVVALGAMFVFTAVISGILVALGLAEDLTPGEATDVGIATGIGLVAAQFLSYTWGGYAAGRMSRGAGAANGALVALLAILVGVAVGAIAAGIGSTEDVRTPFNSTQLPADGEVLRWGAGLAIAAVAAMFVGAIVGGSMGSRWHTKLERRAVDERTDRRIERRGPATDRVDTDGRTGSGRETIDLREGRRTDTAVTTRRGRE